MGLVLYLLILFATPSLADLRVTYTDSSPDLIMIENRSGCDLGPFELTIDLGRSPAGLIFDTTANSPGLAGFAPLTIVSGKEQVLDVSAVTDGDDRLLLKLDFLRGGGSVSLAVDIDDTSPASALGQTIVAGSEIAGSEVAARLTAGGPFHTGAFGADGVAVVPVESCIS
jgi:hypothetical protein